MPKISVLLAQRNSGPYLRPAVESILTQTERDLELLLVDDASTDGAIDALEAEVKDPRMRILRQETSRNQINGILRAFSECSGAYIASMDGDDIAMPRRLEHQLWLLEADPDLGLVSCMARDMDDQGEDKGPRPTLLDPAQLHAATAYYQPLLHPGFFMRRSVFEGGPYRGEFHAAGDFDFLSRAAERTKIGCVPLELMRYRVHGKGVSVSRVVEQMAHACAVRQMTHRRRDGRDERYDATMAALAELLGGQPSLDEVHLRYARSALNEGHSLLAAQEARLSLRAKSRPATLKLYERATRETRREADSPGDSLAKQLLLAPLQNLLWHQNVPDPFPLRQDDARNGPG